MLGSLGFGAPRRITEKKSALQFCKAGFVFEVWGITLSPYFLRSYLPVLYIFSLSLFHLPTRFNPAPIISKCSNNVLLQKGNPWPPFCRQNTCWLGRGGCVA